MGCEYSTYNKWIGDTIVLSSMHGNTRYVDVEVPTTSRH